MAKPYIPYDGPIVTRSDALSVGATRFFTGKPCKHGHLSERTSANGGCIRCNAITGAELYQADKPRRYLKSKAWKAANLEKVRALGRQYSKAHRDQANAWKAANRNSINAAGREYNKRNSDALSAKARLRNALPEAKAARQTHYVENRDAVKRRVREWKLKHPDRALASRKTHYEANKDAIKQRVREWNEANPEGPRVRGRNYRARKYQAEGSHTRAEIKALFVKQAGLCVYCRARLTAGYHADHIQPLARGGSNWISNIQLTCGPCNNRKRAIDPIEFARRLKCVAA